MPMFERGETYHRQTDLHGRFGGNRQSGIAPCASHPLVLLFSSPRGEEFGYRDGWVSPTEYSYTGEGQSGDMEMARGNRAVMEHETVGRELHLFEKVESGYYEYLGRFRYVGHQVRQGPDVDGESRSQILFRLELIPDQTEAAGFGT
jgi:5-methylcytosine-specific restriction protein A